ncbi:MAG: hypothetical protein JXA97_08475 [Anaerolineales bacterium]|nr:hypothetical protein [Anaerolineales bacterium]
MRRTERITSEEITAPTPAFVNAAGGNAPGDEPLEIALMLGVDSLTATQPLLRSIWIIQFRDNGSEIHLLGIPVDLRLGGPASASLQDLFAFSPGAGIDADFLATVNLLAPRNSDYHILLDEHGLEAVLDFLGGANLDGDTFSGSQIIRVLRLLIDDPAANLKLQAQIVESFASHAFELSSSLDITPLIDLVPEHAHVSHSVLELSSLAAGMLPIQPEAISIDLFLPER